MSRVRNLFLNSVFRVAVIGMVVTLAAFGTVFAITRHDSSQTVAATTKCAENITCVALKNDHAEPDAVTVPVGGYVQFNSADGQLHNMGLGTGDEHHDGSHQHTGTYVSGDFKADEAWKVQFKEAGTFDFHDHYRPELHVSVIVYKPGGDYRIK